MKKLLAFVFVILLSATIVYSKTVDEKNINVSNSLFSISIPYEFKNEYIVKKRKQGIYIFHKASYKAGFGGFAFGFGLYKNPKDHAMMVGSRKIGELINKKGAIYDVVLTYPTDVQYDYTKGEDKNYMELYNLGENIDIKGKCRFTYYKNHGMKGEDLYKNVLKKHIIAIKEKWDSAKLEEENMSYMYNVISKTCKNPLDKIGYAYYDSNGDGIDELFIGEIAQDNLKGVAYDIYTMVDRYPSHVVSGGARDRYFACDNSFICREYSSGAGESGVLTYIIVENSTELYPQVGFKYDGYKNKSNPWFISYDFEKDEWKNVSKTVYNERKEVFTKYERFNYTPLSEVR